MCRVGDLPAAANDAGSYSSCPSDHPHTVCSEDTAYFYWLLNKPPLGLRMLLHRRAAFLLTTTALSTSTPSVTITVRAMSNDNSANNGNAEAGAAKMQGALIFLHGLGDGPAGWMSLKHQLPRLQPRLANIHYVFPAAPTIPISINGGGTYIVHNMVVWLVLPFDLYEDFAMHHLVFFFDLVTQRGMCFISSFPFLTC